MVIERIISLLFPNFCESCSKPAMPFSFLCDDCKKSIVGPLKQDFSISGTETARSYSWYEPPFSDMIKAYKFHNRERISRWLAEKLFLLLIETIPVSIKTKPVIIPVPTTISALRARGYDTNRKILIALSKKLQFTLLEPLLATGKHTPQTLLNKEERKKTQGKFRLRSNTIKLPEEVILFDDVLTTGTTIKDCIKSLKEGGVKKVHARTLARTRDKTT
ncbi:MAG: ComF family protein [Kosmotoga sp.]|nr:MAG: ComF family protein [Kosmotoga sp.]